MHALYIPSLWHKIIANFTRKCGGHFDDNNDDDDVNSQYEAAQNNKMFPFKRFLFKYLHDDDDEEASAAAYLNLNVLLCTFKK